MKRKDIILDFTSLLDVTLIIIFFFVLFSHINIEDNSEKTRIKTQELENSKAEYETKTAEAEETIAKLNEEIATVRNSSARRASDIEELLSFDNSDNLKIILDVKSEGWVVRIISDKEVIAIIDDSTDTSQALLDALQEAGFQKDQTIFCDFVYDGSVPKTNAAVKRIDEALNVLGESYYYLYISRTNLSVGKDL